MLRSCSATATPTFAAKRSSRRRRWRKSTARPRRRSGAGPTVRQGAAAVLTPMPTTAALAALAAQLDQEYAPLHQAVRESLIHPADAPTRQAVIELAAKMLRDPNPRRREDASYVLGRLRSD